MKTLLLKNLIFTLFVFGFVEFTFSQSYDQNVLNQNIQLRSKEINRETDSLSTVLADLKRNFEKSNSVDAKKIQDFKTTEKYDSIIRLQFITDSTLTSNKQHFLKNLLSLTCEIVCLLSIEGVCHVLFSFITLT